MKSQPTFWQFLKVLHLLYKDKRTPPATKILPVLALIYVLIPVDFIPDITPLLGWLDDLGMVPFLLYLAFRKANVERIVTALQKQSGV